MRIIKRNFLFFLLLAVAITLSACANKQVAKNSDIINRRPDFGQPERPADISGIVASIIGNEVTVLKIERPDRDNANNAAGNDSGDAEAEGQSRNLGTAFNGSSGRIPGAGGVAGGGMRGGGFAMNADNQAQILERMKEMSSGEEKVIIPVGIQMLKPDSENTTGEISMMEATLSDITANKMLRIWFDENITDKNIATFVVVN
ncbi:MAG: hypothetical protein WC323_04390 [Patescibacteria group bacterium]|jgi:hypothetical protein